MRIVLSIVLLSCAVGTAQAQIKCWTDANGKRVCGDAPPAGAKVQTLKNPSSAPAPAAAASKDGKDAKDTKKSGPMTPGEAEQDYRKRQADAEKASAKADLEAKEAATKKANCASAQDTLRSMESGRVQRIDAKGERVYLDDAQVQQETVKARQLVDQWCR